MPGLLLIVASAQGARLEAGIEVAAASAALGRQVAVLLRGDAVGALAALSDGLALLTELGVEIAICQTALASHELSAENLPAGIEPLGMMAFLGGRADWQMLLV